MATKAASLSFRRSALPAEWNWKADTQPEKLQEPKEYVALAKRLVDPALRHACSVLLQAGYIQPKEFDKTLAKLKKLTPLDHLYLTGVTVKWRIKDVVSAEAKILKDGKTPDDIGDYFGIKYIAATVSDIERLRDAILNDPNMTSRKCEFTYPSDRGYRAHKSHTRVGKNMRNMSLEDMVTHAEFEQIEELTHDYIELERLILDRLSMTPKSDKKTIKELKAASRELKVRRTTLNCSAAEAIGLNTLCAPDAVIPKPEILDFNSASCPENYASSLLLRHAPERARRASDASNVNAEPDDTSSQLSLGLS